MIISENERINWIALKLIARRFDTPQFELLTNFDLFQNAVTASVQD